MKKRKKIHRSKLLKFIINYGLHILLILVIANVVLFYTVQRYTHATSCMTQPQVTQDNRCLYIWGTQVFEQGTHDAPFQGIACGTDLNAKLAQGNAGMLDKIVSTHLVGEMCSADQSTIHTAADLASGGASLSASETVSLTPSPTLTPTPTPIPGPILDLSFTIPGIGSGGGTMNPLHKTRNIIIYLYPPTVSAFNKNIKPLFTSTAQMKFDDNTLSPTYTQFINHHIDLGGYVKDGQYQVVFKMDQALPKLITKLAGNVAGVPYSLNRFSAPQVPLQSVIIGDISPLPHGDGIIDIHDYNAVVGCFSNIDKSPTCPNKQLADLDDNGVVDGIDYNLVLSSFKLLLSLGYPIPTQPPVKSTISISPTITKQVKPTAKPTVQPKATVKTASKKGSPLGGFLLFLFFLLLLGGGGFFAWKRGLLDKYLKLLPGKQPPAEKTPEETPAQPAADSSVPQPETPPVAETPVTPAAPEKPVASEPAPVSTPEVPPVAPSAATPATETPAGNEYFVKKKSVDEKGGGIWLTLTDDNGQHLAYYKGADADIKEGFATVKGTMTKEGDTSYLFISEIKFEE